MKSDVHGHFLPSLNAHFGDAADYNRLLAGQLVDYRLSPGLRPTFAISNTPIVPWSTFFVLPQPSLSCRNHSGYDWYTYCNIGKLVCVPGTEPVNVLFTLPRLVASPVVLEPELPHDVTSAQWRAAGLDHASQAPIWRFPNLLHANIRVSCTSYQYEYFDFQGQQAARLKRSLTPSTSPYTEGQPIEPGIDFAQIQLYFDFIKMQDRDFPPGTYQFECDVDIIPRSAAYSSISTVSPVENYRNRYLETITERVTKTITMTALVPEALVVPSVTSVFPSPSLLGTRLTMVGTRLNFTNRVTFSPGVPADFSILSDTVIEVTVPQLAQSGPIVVETRLGWVRVDLRDELKFLNKQPLDIAAVW